MNLEWRTVRAVLILGVAAVGSARSAAAQNQLLMWGDNISGNCSVPALAKVARSTVRTVPALPVETNCVTSNFLPSAVTARARGVVPSAMDAPNVEFCEVNFCICPLPCKAR